MRTGMMALALGMICLRFVPALPPVEWWVAGLLVSLGCLITRVRSMGWFGLGLCWACWSAQGALDDRLPVALDGRTLWVEGVVSGLPRQTGQGVRFELSEAQSRRASLPARLQLSWFDGPLVRSGERWRLAVTLKRPDRKSVV